MVKEKPEEPVLARVDYCRGCSKAEGCTTRLNHATLNSLNHKRTPRGEKYNECHTIFEDCVVVARPPNDKETRRRFGESAIHY